MTNMVQRHHNTVLQIRIVHAVRRWIAGVLCLGICVCIFAVTMATSAQAQERRRTLFDLLFGNTQQQTRPMPSRQQPALRTIPKRMPASRSNQPKPAKHAPVNIRPKAATVAQPQIMPKNTNASKILVIGDFLANGLAEGLEEAFAEAPDIQVINKITGSSGFVRQDYYNWTQELPTILSALQPEAPDVIVLMIGANDRQSISDKGNAVAPDSDEWHKLYAQRVDEFIGVVGKSGIPLIWVGQPPYKSTTLSQTMLGLNKIFKAAAEKNIISKQAAPAQSGEAAADTRAEVWVDIWNGFADDSGNYSQTGVDMNGQPARLRGNDGINLTSAGKRKLAFYVEKPLRQLLKPVTPLSAPAGTTSGPLLDTLTSERIGAPVSKVITHIGPMSINELDPSDDTVLLGEAPPKAPLQNAEPKRRSTPPFGRTDDFHLR